MQFESSFIKEFFYKDGVLSVELLNGMTYEYQATEEIYANFRDAPSKGKFFNQNIKGVLEEL